MVGRDIRVACTGEVGSTGRVSMVGSVACTGEVGSTGRVSMVGSVACTGEVGSTGRHRPITVMTQDADISYIVTLTYRYREGGL